MKKTETRMVEAEVTIDHICDCCGGSCTNQVPLFGQMTEGTNYAELRACWGWGSGKDGESHNIELCEECFDAVLSLLAARRAASEAVPISASDDPLVGK